jgi:ribulose 1,5-bisphosphate synthetase/thiazole synthase
MGCYLSVLKIEHLKLKAREPKSSPRLAHYFFFHTMAKQSPLEIGIVGGGIAGLSAAIALKRAGHKVEVTSLLIFHIMLRLT